MLSSGITIGGKTLTEHLEVIGHKDAIDYIEELEGRDTVIGEWEIRELHSLILRPVDLVTGVTDASRYRTLDVKAAGTNHEYPPHYRIPELMESFAAWLNSADAARIHPVARATEVHYRLASIHPFRDGNGRTARLLMNLSLLRDGYPPAILPRERRKEYIDALIHAQSHANDLAPLTTFLADAARETLIEHLAAASTASGSKGKGFPFYSELLELVGANN